MSVGPKPQEEPEDKAPGSDDGYATLPEIREAIEGLSDADVEKLMVAAQYFWKRRVDGVRDAGRTPRSCLERPSFEPSRGTGDGEARSCPSSST